LDARKETDPQKLINTLNSWEKQQFGGSLVSSSIGDYLKDTYDSTTGQLKPGAEMDLTKEAHLDRINELRGRMKMAPLFQRADERGTEPKPEQATPVAATVDTVAIRAPDGTVRRVPRANAQNYVSKGGVVVE
jgi:hypothetical protein